MGSLEVQQDLMWVFGNGIWSGVYVCPEMETVCVHSRQWGRRLRSGRSRVGEWLLGIRACSLAPSPLKPGGAGPGGRGAVFRGNGYGALADMNWQVQNPAGTLSERLSMFLTTCSPRPRSLSLVIPSASSVSLQIIALPAADAASRVNGPTSQTSRSRRTSSDAAVQ